MSADDIWELCDIVGPVAISRRVQHIAEIKLRTSDRSQAMAMIEQMTSGVYFAGVRIPVNKTTDSGAKRPPIPIQSDQLIRSIPTTL